MSSGSIRLEEDKSADDLWKYYPAKPDCVLGANGREPDVTSCSTMYQYAPLCFMAEGHNSLSAGINPCNSNLLQMTRIRSHASPPRREGFVVDGRAGDGLLAPVGSCAAPT